MKADERNKIIFYLTKDGESALKNLVQDAIYDIEAVKDYIVNTAKLLDRDEVDGKYYYTFETDNVYVETSGSLYHDVLKDAFEELGIKYKFSGKQTYMIRK